MEILNLLNPKNTVSFSRPLAHALGLAEALVYSALISKQEYYSARGMLTDDGWFYSTIADMQESTTLSKRQQSAAVKSLVSLGLIEYKKCGLPARRFFRVSDDAALLEAYLGQGEETMTHLNPIAQKQSDNAPAGRRESAPPEVPERADQPEQSETVYNPNQKNQKEINPVDINPYPSIPRDGNDTNDNTAVFISDNEAAERSLSAEERRDYREMILENIGYRCFQDKSGLDELVDIMLDVVCSGRRTIRVNGEDMPKDVVAGRFLKLGPEHVSYVREAMQNNTSAVRNIRAYLITALYNAPSTIDSYYSSQVNHDMYGAQG